MAARRWNPLLIILVFAALLAVVVWVLFFRYPNHGASSGLSPAGNPVQAQTFAPIDPPLAGA